MDRKGLPWQRTIELSVDLPLSIFARFNKMELFLFESVLMSVEKRCNFFYPPLTHMGKNLFGGKL